MFWIVLWFFFMFASMMIAWHNSWIVGLVLMLLLSTCTPEPIMRALT